jgi:RNA polymerase sigma-70 factor, ECF subfamily
MSPLNSDIDGVGIPDDELLRRIRQGDQAAERALFERYYARLVSYVRRKMYPQLQQVAPPSDIAQSAMKSVLLGIPIRQFSLDEGQNLWPLLVTITLNKISKRGKKFFSLRRDIGRNQPMDAYDCLSADDDAASQAELNDLVGCLLDCFTDRRRRIVELLLQDWGVGEIAAELAISEKTVYRTRQQAIASLQELLGRQGSEIAG